MRNRIFPCGGWIATLRAAILGGAVLAVAAPGAAAADFPERPLKIVVPYAPGGSTDVVARMLGEKLAAKFGQPVLVENRPGASEQIASAYVAKSTADGYTIMLATMAGLAVNPWLYQLPYDVLHDFAPIVTAVKMPSFIVVNPQTPVKSVPQLTDYLRNNRVSYATAGTGTPSHLAMEMYKKYAKVDAESVQYKGGAPALQDVMAGHVPVMVALAPEALPYIKGGKLRALAVTSAARSPFLPDVPAVTEYPDLKGFEIDQWLGFVAPAGTPGAVVNTLNQAINEALADPQVRSRLAELSILPQGGSVAHFTQLMRNENVKWRQVIKDAGIKLQ